MPAPKTQGQQDCEKSLVTCPNYHNGTPRHPWDNLAEICQYSWEKPYIKTESE